MQSTKIEYLTHTWNPFAMRCTPISEGCANCWHLRMANRLSYNRVVSEEQAMAYGGEGPLLISKELSAPFHRIKPSIVGVQFMGDLFHESLTDEQIAAVFGVMAATPQHQYVVMTKRLQRALEWFTYGLESPETTLPVECLNRMAKIVSPTDRIRYKMPKWPLENVIICASVEDQSAVDERVPLLLQIPARWRGVSAEPMLSRIDLDCFNPSDDSDDTFMSAFRYSDDEDGLDLVICGAETGPGKRPFKDEWALNLRDQCKAASVPFFFKKDGAGKPTLCGVEYHEWVK